MPVSADIRALPRPVNTIVDDNGRNGPKRYAVITAIVTIRLEPSFFQVPFINSFYELNSLANHNTDLFKLFPTIFTPNT